MKSTNCSPPRRGCLTILFWTHTIVLPIILIILLIIAVPIYMSYVNKARATEAQSAIAAIRSAFRVQYQTYGTTEGYAVEDALIDAKLGNAIEKNWEFEVIGNPPTKYIATSTSEFPGGEGKQVWYDVEEALYHGYGIDREEQEEENID